MFPATRSACYTALVIATVVRSSTLGVLAGGAACFAITHASCASGGDTNPQGSTGSSQDGGTTTFNKDAACEAIRVAANVKPLHLYVALDGSSSMAGTKWEAAKAGLSVWAHDERSEGIQVALNFFPRPAGGPPACDQKAYQTPAVDYGVLIAHADALDAAMSAKSPDGFSSPVYPALGGAILASIERAQNAPGEVAAVLLVTDGKPQGPAPMCGQVNPEDPQVLADLAATGRNFMYPVITYVVGLPGVDQSIANQIAAAGGSDSAILVGSTNVANEFRDALSKVRGDAVPCDYEIPPTLLSGEVAITDVNIEISFSGQPALVLPQDPTCAAEGWRFDDSNSPTAITLCDTTCDQLKADTGASIEVLLGCTTVVR